MAKRLNVLFISHNDAGMGGAPRSLLELVVTLKKYFNVNPIMVVPVKDDVYKYCKDNQITCYVTQYSNVFVGKKYSIKAYLEYLPKRLYHDYKNYKAFKYLRERVNFKTLDMIHSNVSVTSLGEYIYKKSNIPHIVHLRESNNVIENFMYDRRNYIGLLNRNVDRFIAISKFAQKEWIDQGLSKDKVDLVYNGLQLPLHKNKKLLFQDSKVKMVIVGKIQKEKGQIDVIKAIASMPLKYKNKFSLDLIGTSEEVYEKSIKSYIKKYNLSGIVKLKGYNSNASNILKKYDIGIMSSSKEAFGRTTVEYMANGLCTVGANSGATPEIIQDNKTGYLYSHSDYRTLTRVLIKILQNKDKAQQVAISGQQEVYNRFTTFINAQNVYHEYEKVLK